jgi:hypothetical protein
MRSERRHELEENDLADTTAAVLEKLRPHLAMLAAVAVLFVGAVAAWTLIAARREATRAESWDACATAINERSGDGLADVIRRYPGTPAAQWAQLTLADSASGEGSRLVFTDKVRGRERLDAAEQAYVGLLAERPVGLVAERATFGLAKVRESLGNLDEARRGYEAVVAEHPGSAVRGMAEQRIAALSRPSARQWYAWFDEQKPEPPAAASAPPAADAPAAGAGTGPAR